MGLSYKQIFEETLEEGETLLSFFGNENVGCATWTDKVERHFRGWIMGCGDKRRSIQAVELESVLAAASMGQEELWSHHVRRALERLFS